MTSKVKTPAERAEEMCKLYLSGVTWREIGRRYNFKDPVLALKYARRYTTRSWPLQRRPEVAHRVFSERMRKVRRSVETTFIIEMMNEYIEEHGLTVAEFARTRLGMTSFTQWNQLYEFRTRRTKTRMSGDMAARILRGIGEPVREDLIA